ncbi:hypothetical protein GX586_01550 [bacterium]|nr:hypothetical protein [bacterium]
MKRILFIAGEASGDQHGAFVVRALKRRMPDADLYGVGGDDMRAAGLRLIHNITELSVIGLVEVAKSYFRLKAVFDDLLRHVDSDRPDAVVLIDYPGFNLRIAKRIKAAHPGLPIIYYTSPQIWAWGHRRIYTIRRVVDLMLVLFPFEVDVYEKGGKWLVTGDTIAIKEHHFWRPSHLRVRYVGHPKVRLIEAFTPDPAFRTVHDIPTGRRIIALLSGSRENEIRTIFPVALQCAERIRKERPDTFFLISCAREQLRPLLDAQIHRAGIHDFAGAYRIVTGSMHDVIHCADMVICKSGTSAFEAALMLKPIFVLYRVNFITSIAARIVIKIPFANLANIIAGRRVVPEFLQEKMTPGHIVPAIEHYLDEPALYARTVADLRAVRDTLGRQDSGERAAEEIMAYMKMTR